VPHGWRTARPGSETNKSKEKTACLTSNQHLLPPVHWPSPSPPTGRTTPWAPTPTLVLKGKDTAGAYAFIDMHVPPGGGPVPHAHEFEEMFYVVEGEVAVFCHDSRTNMVAGMAVNIPGWAPHVFKNMSPVVPSRLFCVVSKAGLEEQFVEIGAPVATRTTPPPRVDPAKMDELMKQLPAIAERYHTRILLPDTFDHLMTKAEREIVQAANGQ
jgi:mannose-6-phosphate isomerase-like protein (cupin superfamily)